MTTSPFRMALRSATVAAAATVTLCVAAPAHAAPGANGAPPPVTLSGATWAAPQLSLRITELPRFGFHVCGIGTSALAGTWRMDVTGARSTGTSIAVSATGDGNTFDECVDVTEDGAPSGEFEVTFAYTGGGRVYARAGGGTWDLFSGEHSWDTG
jgi:hypothetical protein